MLFNFLEFNYPLVFYSCQASITIKHTMIKSLSLIASFGLCFRLFSQLSPELISVIKKKSRQRYVDGIQAWVKVLQVVTTNAKPKLDYRTYPAPPELIGVVLYYETYVHGARSKLIGSPGDLRPADLLSDPYLWGEHRALHSDRAGVQRSTRTFNVLAYVYVRLWY